MSIHRRSRSTLIVALLTATLGVTALLAYEAQQAARSHRATAENVLRDYAAFAAWEFSRLGRQQLQQQMQRDLSHVQAALDRGDLASALAPSHSCHQCGDAHLRRTVFYTSLPSTRFTFAGETAS